MQEDYSKFETSLVYKMSTRLARATLWDAVPKREWKEGEKEEEKEGEQAREERIREDIQPGL